MSSLEKNEHNIDSYDRLYSKKELLEEVGISGRTLTNWVFEGVLPKPVLYKGKGGKSFFSKRQIEEASVIKKLNSDHKQSLTKIKAIKQRISEDLFGEWRYDDECYLTVFDTIFGFGEAVSVIKDLAAFIDKKKTLVSQPKNTYRFIETIHHAKKYTIKDGQIRKILYDHEFNRDEYFKIGETDKCFESQAKMSLDLHFYLRDSEGEKIDKRPILDPKEWEHKRRQIVALVEETVMYAPPYFYDGSYYFHNNDICIVADNLLQLCHNMGYGINGGKKFKRRIDEDIQSFFSFSENCLEYSQESLLFHKTVSLFNTCVTWLFYYDRTLPGYGFYGLDPNSQKKIPSLEKFVEFYLDGLLYVSQDGMGGDMPLFRVRPLNMMNHNQLSKASKIGLFTKEEIVAHLEKRIRSDEVELSELRKLKSKMKEPKK